MIEIKTLLPHVMEFGQRKDKDGNAIPRKIINKFACEFNGKPAFSVNFSIRQLRPIRTCSSTQRSTQSGTFKFTWTDDDGTITTAEEKITVS